MSQESLINIGISTTRTEMKLTDTAAIGSTIIDFDGVESAIKSTFIASQRFEFDDEHKQTVSTKDITIKELRAQEMIYGIWVDLPITLRNINGITQLTKQALEEAYFDVDSEIRKAMGANLS